MWTTSAASKSMRTKLPWGTTSPVGGRRPTGGVLSVTGDVVPLPPNMTIHSGIVLGQEPPTALPKVFLGAAGVFGETNVCTCFTMYVVTFIAYSVVTWCSSWSRVRSPRVQGSFSWSSLPRVRCISALLSPGISRELLGQPKVGPSRDNAAATASLVLTSSCCGSGKKGPCPSPPCSTSSISRAAS